MTLVGLSRAVSVDHSQISRYERGEMVSASKNLQKICKYLQIEVLEHQPLTMAKSWGQQVDELLSQAPFLEPAVCALVAALEGLMTSARNPSESASYTPPGVD